MIVRFTDDVAKDYTRLSTAEITEFQGQMNVNTSDENGQWFDEEIPVGYVEEIDEDEFFQRYFS